LLTFLQEKINLKFTFERPRLILIHAGTVSMGVGSGSAGV